MGGPWDVSTYGGASIEGHVPRIFCLPRWVQSDLTEDLEAHREINVVFSLKAHPQPLDIINKTNLRIYRLAPIDNGDEVNEA